MAKLPANWSNSGGSATQTSGSYLLLESGDTLLLEDGTSFLLLEDVTFSGKESSVWDNSTKNSSRWASDGSTTYGYGNANVQRLQTDGITVRTLQDGTIRILQENSPVKKAPTTWDSL